MDILDKMDGTRLTLLNSDAPEVRSDEPITPALFKSWFGK